MNNIYKLNNSLVILIVFTFSLAYQVMHGITMMSDDFWFSNVAKNRVLLEWLVERYNTWSSRTLLEIFLFLFINNKVAWVIVNSAMISILFHSINSITNSNSDIYKTLLLIFCFAVFPDGAFYEAVWWMTGSMNYLWPVSMGMAGWYLLLNGTREARIPTITLATLLLAGSSFNEQMAIINLPILLTLLVFEDKKKYFAPSALCFFVLIYVISATGNDIRLARETVKWMPYFSQYGVLDKLILGLNSCSNFTFGLGSMSISLLCAVILFNAKRITVKLAIFIPFIIITSFFIADDFTPRAVHSIHMALKPVKVDNLSIHDAYTFIRISINLLILLVIGLCITTLFDGLKRKAYALFYFALCFAPIMALGFTPTVYASGTRTIFITVSMIIVLTCFIAKITETKGGVTPPPIF